MSDKISDEREAFCLQNGMTMDFVDWFFENKKQGCGSAWFIMAAAMWEGWQGGRAAEVKPVVLPKEFFDVGQNSRGMFELSEDCMCGVVAAIKAAGGTVKDGE